MIQFNHISKSFKAAPVLRDISFEIETGELVAIIGASGCGKTTLLKMINKLIKPSSGSIVIDGEDIAQMDTTLLRRNMGYVIQQTGLFVHMTVRDNIGVIPTLQGISKPKVTQRVSELLEMVGLHPMDYLDRYPSQLSGGQQQRVGVARAFATDPKIVLMDEPFSALDPITRVQLQDELLILQKKLKKTIVFVTHDIDEALKIADRICILNQGLVEQIDTPEQILLHPANDHVARFIGESRIWNFPQYLTAGHILSSDYTVCPPDEMVNAQSFPLHHKLICVCTEGRTVCGTLERTALPAAVSQPAHELMRTEFVSAQREENLAQVLERMEYAGLSQIPVLDGARLCGCLSQKSLAEHLLAPRIAGGNAT